MTAGGPATHDALESRQARNKALLSLPLIAVILLAGNIAGSILALAWITLTRTPWRAVGVVVPKRWVGVLAASLLGGVALKFLTKAVLMPLLGADPVNATYADLVGNTAALPGMLALVVIAGGIGEELIWRGLLFERLQRVVGSSAGARTAIVIVTAILFGLAHFADQGRDGALQAVITGAVFGTVYARMGSLLPVVAAHASYDVTAVLLIYTGNEHAVAHWLF